MFLPNNLTFFLSQSMNVSDDPGSLRSFCLRIKITKRLIFKLPFYLIMCLYMTISTFLYMQLYITQCDFTSLNCNCVSQICSFMFDLTCYNLTLSHKVALYLAVSTLILFHILNFILQLLFYLYSEAETGFQKWERSRKHLKTDSNQTKSPRPIESH